MKLNLLPLLRALLKECSVTRAANSLGVSQSAASQGLARLRTLLGDPLLVRIGDRMVLTPRAKELSLRVEALAVELDGIFLSNAFDPSQANRSLIIATNDYMAFIVARQMLDLVRSEAPGIQLKFIEIGADFAERMAAQEVDFALMPRFVWRDYVAAPLRYRTLSRQSLGILMDRAHPLAAQEELTEADLLRFEHVGFWCEPFDRGFTKRGAVADEVVTLSKSMPKVLTWTSHMTSLPILLLGTDLIAPIPYGFGAELARVWPLEVRALAFAPGDIDRGMAWSPVFDADPVHVWFRTRIESLMTGGEAQSYARPN